MIYKKEGFTVIELLISITIVLTIVGIIFPFSIYFTQAMRENQEIEQLILKIKNFQRNAYLFNTEHKIYVKDGALWIDDVSVLSQTTFSPIIDQEIIIYPKGTTSGGTIILRGKYGTYKLTLSTLGEVILER